MTNINVADGLTNGAVGTVTGVVLKQNATLQFDHSGIGCDAKSHSKYKHISNDSVPIEKMEVTFKPNKKNIMLGFVDRVSTNAVLGSKNP